MIAWSESELEQLVSIDFLLKRRNHGSLSVIQYHTLSQGLEALVWLKAKRPELHFSELNLTKRRVNSLELELRTFLKGSQEVEPTSEVVVVRGLEFSLFKIEKNAFIKTNLLYTMNFERDLIFRSFGCHFIFLFEPEFTKQLQKYAFDFYDWINSWVFLNEIDFEAPINSLIFLYEFIMENSYFSQNKKFTAHAKINSLKKEEIYIINSTTRRTDTKNILNVVEKAFNDNESIVQFHHLFLLLDIKFELLDKQGKENDILISFLKSKTKWNGDTIDLELKIANIQETAPENKILFVYFYIYMFIKLKDRDRILFSQLRPLINIARKSNLLTLEFDVSTNVSRCQLSSGKIIGPLIELMQVLETVKTNWDLEELRNAIISDYLEYLP